LDIKFRKKNENNKNSISEKHKEETQKSELENNVPEQERKKDESIEENSEEDFGLGLFE